MSTWVSSLLSEISARYKVGEVFHNKTLIKIVLPNVVRTTNSIGLTPEKTMSRTLQELRDLGNIIFIKKMPGCYKLVKTTLPIDKLGKKMSMGERVIYEILTELGHEFIFQKRFKDLRNRGPLSYDFAFNFEGKTILIEMDGAQHRAPVEHWGGHDKFIDQQINDILKSIYAIKNRHILIRFDKVDRARMMARIIEEMDNIHARRHALPGC